MTTIDESHAGTFIHSLIYNQTCCELAAGCNLETNVKLYNSAQFNLFILNIQENFFVAKNKTGKRSETVKV